MFNLELWEVGSMWISIIIFFYYYFRFACKLQEQLLENQMKKKTSKEFLSKLARFFIMRVCLSDNSGYYSFQLRNNKAIAMMRRKSPRHENIYLIENHCQANISKWRRGNRNLILFHEWEKFVLCIHVTMI